jgi:hypothetical protein
MRKTCEGSLTVEGAMVMGITLVLIGGLLLGMFVMEERTAGNMLLAEALERTICAEDGLSAELGITPETIAEGCGSKLRSMFRCGESRLSMDAGGMFRIQGTCAGRVTTEMSVRKNDPEKFLRTLTAIRGENPAAVSGGEAPGRTAEDVSAGGVSGGAAKSAPHGADEGVSGMPAGKGAGP